MGKSQIEWTDKTWNPIRGCSRVSHGCENCYAERQAVRFSGKGQPYEGLVRIANGHPQWTGKIHFAEDKLGEPLRWKKPCRVFVNSMSDLFHEGVKDAELDSIFMVMMATQRHTYQVLTKRPERMREYCGSKETRLRISALGSEMAATIPGVTFQVHCENDGLEGIFIPNVWLGVSVEDQKTANERIPLLLQTPAAVRWVSYEPALGPADLREYLIGREEAGTPLSGARTVGGCVKWTPPLDWLVCGGESGPGARPFNLAWARSALDQCKAANVPFFMKQLGSRHGRDRKGGDMSEWPEDLRVREYPG